MTLRQLLDRHCGIGPGFHLLRHLLAFVILAHHCRIAVDGIDRDGSAIKGAVLTIATVSNAATVDVVTEMLRPFLFALVGSFFALSGFLVTGSALRNTSIRTFFANRALRILPALTVEITLSALVLGPLVTTLPLSDYFSAPSFFRYFGNILGWVAFTLPGVFVDNPWPATVNANLWTLPPEFWCYAAMLALMATGMILHCKRVVLTVSAGVIIALAAYLYDPVRFAVRADSTHFTTWYVVAMFFFGVVLASAAEYVPVSRWTFILSGLCYYCVTMAHWMEPIAGLFLAYCTICAGMIAFPWFDRIVKQDISYGIYLYGFPITQATVFFLRPWLGDYGETVSFVMIFPIVIVITCLLALLSWTYVEKPVLALRRHVIREPRPVTDVSPVKPR